MEPAAIDALLPRDAVHQGLAAQFEPLEPVHLDEIIGAESSVSRCSIRLAIRIIWARFFRSAAAFGFGALILQTRNAPAITGIVAKSAVGAIETVQECRVVNISRALEALSDVGYHTVGLAGEGEATIEAAVSGAEQARRCPRRRRPRVYGRGSLKACAELARIPIASEMESLNVSNAAAIAFYAAAR